MIMQKGIKILFLISGFIFLYSCQIVQPERLETRFPTPYQETLEADHFGPTNTVAKTPHPTMLPEQTATSMPDIKLTETRHVSSQVFPEINTPNNSGNSDLAEQIDQIILNSGGRWHIVIKEVNGPTLYTRLVDQRINIASIVKVPLALLFFAALENRGIQESQLPDYVQSSGTNGRTFHQLLQAMLVKSEEDATKVLAEYIVANLNTPAKLRDWQMQKLDLDARRYSAAEVAILFENLYTGEYISPTAQLLLLDYLREYTPNDETRIGVLRNHFPDNYQIYNKRGSLLTPYVVADAAILENPEGLDFIIVIFSYNSQPKTTYEALDQAIGEIALVFWDYLSNNVK